jgi:uncharacterized protein involved in exopolysaccharide biosynthesis
MAASKNSARVVTVAAASPTLGQRVDKYAAIVKTKAADKDVQKLAAAGVVGVAVGVGAALLFN